MTASIGTTCWRGSECISMMSTLCCSRRTRTRACEPENSSEGESERVDSVVSHNDDQAECMRVQRKNRLRVDVGAAKLVWHGPRCYKVRQCRARLCASGGSARRPETRETGLTENAIGPPSLRRTLGPRDRMRCHLAKGSGMSTHRISPRKCSRLATLIDADASWQTNATRAVIRTATGPCTQCT